MHTRHIQMGLKGIISRGVVIALIGLASVAHAGLSVAPLFSDHMVLQQGVTLEIWGTGEVGKTVEVQFAGQSVEARVTASGTWRIPLQPMEAHAKGQDLSIGDAQTQLVLHDVVVGEVWLAAGQSNMQMQVRAMAKKLPETTALVEDAKSPGIRFLRIEEPVAGGRRARSQGSQAWQICSSETVPSFSAVAWVFARRLHKDLDVPVGVIDVSWGGKPIEPFIPGEAFTDHPLLGQIKTLADQKKLDALATLTGGTVIRNPEGYPGAIYDARIRPIAGCGLRGFIWYQAESNCGQGEDPRGYRRKMEVLVDSWRKAWGHSDLPFYFVQLPNYPGAASGWIRMREEQRRSLAIPHTGMAVTIDTGSDDVHPANKIDVGERLALLALHRNYGTDVVDSGPLYQSHTIAGRDVTVRFKHADRGLMVARKVGLSRPKETPKKMLAYFELAGEDSIWFPAEAHISGNTVHVSSEHVSAPQAVRYACLNDPKEDLLYNRNGLPASPFCSTLEGLAWRKWSTQSWRGQEIEQTFDSLLLKVSPLCEAIVDLSETFPDRYPQKYRAMAEELKHVEVQFEQYVERTLHGDEGTLTEAKAFVRKLEALKHDALLANPLLQDYSLLYVTRKQYRTDHHNTATIFQKGEINEGSYDPPGKIKVLNPKTGQVMTLVDAGRTGITRDPEISMDGTQVVFSMRKSKDDDYHLYEINTDGTGIKQLTSLRGVSDIDPVYLPDGKIIFSSTREPKFCMCNRHIMANLYRMDADGANIHQIGKSTLFEGHSSVMEDGRILYDRWEYVDRNFGDAQGLWVVNPDGTLHAIYYGNNTPSPGGVVDARQIPGSPRVISIFSSCHDRPWGALAIVNRNKGVDGVEPVETIWPASARQRIGVGDWDSFKQVRPRYEDPYPLADLKTNAGAGTYFLCARTIRGENERTGIYLIDTFGNEVLVHEEQDGLGCFDPMTIMARQSPRARSDRRDFENGNGSFYVQNVYEGTHMKGIKQGEVKYLRVVESPEKRSWSNGGSWSAQGVQYPAMNWHSFENKRILGTVPVEEDGSAYFEVPSDRFVYFQLLDKNRMMVQSMRSGTVIQSGEVQGCVGCHENRVGTPPPSAIILQALKRPASPMGKGYGAGRLFNYLSEVQPVFDKHCVSCHDFGKPEAKFVNLAGDKEFVFNASYSDLWRKKLVTLAGGGPADIKEAKSWGSHASRLTEFLDCQNKTKLTADERRRVTTWLDLNGIYYPTYDCAYPENATGRNPLTDQQVNRLGKLCGFDPKRGFRWHQHPGAMVSFDRPDISPCLQKLAYGSTTYNKALAIIQQGAENLRITPRADMPGFLPSERDQKRTARYEELSSKELAFRKAIREGRKLYDADMQSEDDF
ncbi:sialate O-acetylesterase [Planctomycetota bacterium]